MSEKLSKSDEKTPKTAKSPQKMTTQEIKRWIRWAKKNGLQSLTIGEVSFTLSETPKLVPKLKAVEPTVIPTTKDPNAVMPPDDEMLEWSTSNFDILRATRESN